MGLIYLAGLLTGVFLTCVGISLWNRQFEPILIILLILTVGLNIASGFWGIR